MPEQAPENNFPIVAIGASAGGFEAFTKLLHAIPSNTGMAIIFIQHLDPEYQTNMSALLSKHTEMPIVTAEDNIKLEPDRVYLLPAL